MTHQQDGPAVVLPALPHPEPLSEAVLFSFDDRALPFREGLEMRLIPGTNPQVVLRHGPGGSHDEVLLFYGTVIKIGDTLHMWYNANHGPLDNHVNIERRNCVIAYATSTDGVSWEKPELGLVEFAGSKGNNIVVLDEPGLWSTAAVIHDPEDSEDRRFKIAYEARRERGVVFCVAFSPDGLRWTPFTGNPVGPFLEMAGIAKFRGRYYVNGQARSSQRGPFVRQVSTFVSSDFEHWSPAPALGLNRSGDLDGPSMAADLHQFEEIHLGAALWNRGSVLLGIYGQWHGHPSGDRRLTTIDLGLAISHDALHFHEPIRNFRFIPAREQPESPTAYLPALQQGQGMENIGERTLYWYSLWRGTEGSGVRMVSWERDRLGYLSPYGGAGGRVVSTMVKLRGGRGRVSINASGLGDRSRLRVSLLDDGFRPIDGFSGDDAVVVAESGFRTALRWRGGDVPASEAFHVDVAFDGVRPEDARLHAIYVEAE
jgi:hypothetical protein